MTRKELHEYWRYYLILEKRFIETIEFTELFPTNYKSFSNNYALLMQAIGAEMDTMFKIYCGFNTNDYKSISDYAKNIDDEEQNKKPQHAIDHPFRNQEIQVTGYGITLQPFKDWDNSKPKQSLAWWDAFDCLKHNRYESRDKANQQNALNMLSALFLLEMKMLKKITEGKKELDIFDNGSDLFSLKSWSNKVVPLKDAFGVLSDMMEKGENFAPKSVDV
ncbi:MAG: hypothetical protein J6N15_06505 [Ruminiclostridium sp.]|nr:hypothetical protein [Ruminiclostridium sp.]